MLLNPIVKLGCKRHFDFTEDTEDLKWFKTFIIESSLAKSYKSKKDESMIPFIHFKGIMSKIILHFAGDGKDMNRNLFNGQPG